ncbi:MAG: phage holin family protein [bacterium]|nr:phage holin family protein [bacterium]
MTFLLQWAVYALSVGIAAYVLPGVSVSGVPAAAVAALILGIVNAFVRPLLLILTLPVTVLSLGLFAFVINALLILLVAAIVPGFAVAGFWWAVLLSIVLTIVRFALSGLLR